MEHKSFLIVAKAVVLDKRLTVTARLVLAQLVDHKNKKTGQCNPKQATLAEELGISVDTVQRALKKMRDLGLITIKRSQYGCSYEIQIPQNAVSQTAKCGFPKPQNAVSEAPVSLYEPNQMNLGEEEHALLEGLVPAPPAPRLGDQGDLFPLFFQCFVNAGVALNGKDEKDARRVFNTYPREEQERIGKWVIEQLQTVWRSPEFTPTPLSALRKEGWKRQAMPRIVPKPVGREEEFVRLLRESRARRSQA